MPENEVLKIFKNIFGIRDRSEGEPNSIIMPNQNQKGRLSAGLIIRSVADYYGFEVNELKAKGRKQEVALARQIAVFLLREYLEKSYPAIGKYFGSRDHTTAMHAYRKISALITESPDLKLQIDEIVKIIFGNLPPVRKKEGREKREIRKKRAKNTQYFRSSRSSLPKVVERDSAILSEYRRGKTLQQIGEERKLTRERIRQIVLRAVFREMESKKKEGFEIDSDEYLKQEKIKRVRLKPKKEKKEKPQRWSRFYARCRGCGTTIIPHLRQGYCEKCLDVFGKQRRDELVESMGSKCAHCGIDRNEARSKYGRDFYITSSEGGKIILCRGCFLRYTGSKLAQSRIRRNNS